MICVGADPGLHGAIAVLECKRHGERPVLVGCWDIPTAGRIYGKVARPRYVLPDVANLLKAVAVFEPETFVIEEVQGYGHQKGSSYFGYGVGILHMAATIYGLPISVCSPSRWKADLRCPAAKSASVRMAEARIADGGNGMFRGPKGGGLDGRAEAALLAYWGWVKLARRSAM